MTTFRSKPTPGQDAALKALRQWEKDTGSPASATEGNAFLDGFLAGRKSELKINAKPEPFRLNPRERVFIIEYFGTLFHTWSRSLDFPNFYTEEEADCIVSRKGNVTYRKREIAYA